MASSSAYNRELVERLVPAIFEEVFAYGMVDPRAPDHDMPKGFVDKKKGSALFAHLIDIRSAWKHCELTIEERRALFMRYCLDWTLALVGHEEGVSPSTIMRRCERGVGKLTAHLNGERYVDGYDAMLDEESMLELGA